MTTFSTAALSSALSQVMAPTKKPSQGQHSFVLVRYTDSGVAVLESVNSTMRCSSLASGVDGDSIECLVHAEMLQGAIENGSGDQVKVEIVDGRLKLLRGSQKTMLPILPVTPENWTEDPNPKALARVSIEAKELIPILKSASFIARSCNRVELRMVEISGKGTVSVCATNSTAVIIGRLSATCNSEFCINVPPEAAQEVVANCESDIVLVKVYENAVKFQCGEFSIQTTLVANAKRITEQTVNILDSVKAQRGDDWFQVVGSREAITQAVNAAEAIAKKKTRPSIRMIVSDGSLKVESDNGDSSTEAIVDCETKNAGSFLTNGTQLAQLLSNCKGDKLTIWKATTKSPIMFGDDIEKTTFVTMEVRE